MSNGYYVDVQKIAYTTDITSTNIKLGFYEAGADAAVLDAVANYGFVCGDYRPDDLLLPVPLQSRLAGPKNVQEKETGC